MTQQIVKKIQEWLIQEKLDVFLVPRGDMFQGETVSPCDERLKYLTGFTGSAGLAIVGQKKSALFVDGRYTLQAPAQVDETLFKILQVPQNRATEWVKINLSAGGLVGFDPWLHPLEYIRQFKKAFTNTAIIMKPADVNPVSMVWEGRPKRESNPVWLHDLDYAGKSSQDKLQNVKDYLNEKDLAAVIITDPASVSWLFNIRGNDVPNTPLAQSVAWVSAEDEDILFIDPKKMTDDVKQALGSTTKIVQFENMSEAVQDAAELGTTVQVDPKHCPYALYNMLTVCGVSIHEAQDPCAIPKACCNETELKGAHLAHLWDGVAVTKLLHWLDMEAETGQLDELQVVQKLHELRGENENFVGDSFDTIAGFGSNGAIVHYRAEEETNKTIKQNNLLLVDSGGQYRQGTTDITRTVVIGQPTKEMQTRFTCVLKGMIAITQVRFPVGTIGSQLDSCARFALWSTGLDYSHGTGHGVGSFLGVHDGPQGISSRAMTPLKPGMILSNEPGYYKTDEYGIRIENLIYVVDDKKDGDELPMLAFETLTLAPIDMRLIDMDLLTDGEKEWLTNYHKDVVAKLGDALSPIERDWLTKSV